MRTAILGSVLAAACHGAASSSVPPQPATVLITNDLDVLFVIENSADAADIQAALAINMPRLFTALDALPNGRPNLHVGVASTSVSIGRSNRGANCANGDDGVLQNTARVTGCTPPSDHYIVDVANGTGSGAPVCGVDRTCNYPATESIATALTCIAALGTGGCGFEAPLEAMRRAVDGSHVENAGFVRPTALLAVLIVMDDDDCSVRDPSFFDLTVGSPSVDNSDFRCHPLYAYSCDQPISDVMPGTYTSCVPRTDSYLEVPAAFHDALTALKAPYPSAIVVEAIVGDPSSTIGVGSNMVEEPSCMAIIDGNTNTAEPGNRIADFAERFADHGLVRSTCQSDYSQTLTDFGTLVGKALSPCIVGKLDTHDVDATNPGLQLTCTATMLPDVVLPACTMTDAATPAPASPQPCYWLEPDATACTATASQVAVHLVGAPRGSSVGVACVGAP